MLGARPWDNMLDLNTLQSDTAFDILDEDALVESVYLPKPHLGPSWSHTRPQNQYETPTTKHGSHQLEF